MRNELRIPICLELLFKNEILYKFLNDNTPGNMKLIHTKWEEIENKWKKYPDLRFGQLLCNEINFPKKIDDHIWNIEEDDWLIENGYCNIEDIKFWGVNYYKNGKLRKKTKFRLLKNLNTDHIKSIIIFFENSNLMGKLHKKYLEYFNKRINEL